MREYLLAQRKETKALEKSKKAKKRRHGDETPEERRARKERKRERRARKEKTKSEGVKGVESLLRNLDRAKEYRETPERDTDRSGARRRTRSPSYNRGRRNVCTSRSPEGNSPRVGRSEGREKDD